MPRSSANFFNLRSEIANRIEGAITKKKSFVDQCRELSILTKESEVVRFILHSGQKYYWNIRKNHKKNLVAKCRQGGFTTIEMAHSYLQFKTRSNCRQKFMADTEPKAIEIFDMATRFYEFDKNKPAIKTMSKKHLNGRSGSVLRCDTPGGKAAGRGGTMAKIHGSEVPYWFNRSMNFDRANLIMQGITIAAKKGEVVFEGTANGDDPWFHPMWLEPKDYNRIFVPWHAIPEYRLEPEGGIDEVLDTLTEKEKGLIDEFKLDACQIEWRRKEIESLGKLFFQEYAEDETTMFIVSGTTLFDTEYIDGLINTEEQPYIGRCTPEYGGFEQYCDINPNLGYVIGVDVAKGVDGGDWSAVSIRDENGGHCATGKWKDDPEALGRRVARLAKEWNNALLAIESNNFGRSTINTVVNEEKYHRVANDVRWNPAGAYFQVIPDLGVTLTDPLRTKFFADAYKNIEVNKTRKVHGVAALKELRSIVKVNGKKYEGIPHDDITLADMHCNFVLETQSLDTVLAV